MIELHLGGVDSCGVDGFVGNVIRSSVHVFRSLAVDMSIVLTYER